MNINQTIQRVAAAYNALDNIYVRGHQNVLNLAAAMQLLYDEKQELSAALEEKMVHTTDVPQEAQCADRAK